MQHGAASSFTVDTYKTHTDTKFLCLASRKLHFVTEPCIPFGDFEQKRLGSNLVLANLYQNSTDSCKIAHSEKIKYIIVSLEIHLGCTL